MKEKIGPKNDREKYDKRIILEIGAGSSPVIRGIEREKKFEEDVEARYISVDHFAYDTKKVSNPEQRKKILNIQAHGEHLPIKNESVTELVMRNVLGDPTIDDGVKRAMILESIRALKKDGQLKIIEQITPEVALKWKDEILKITNNQLELARQISKNEAKDSKDIDAQFIAGGLSGSFIWIFIKKIN